MLSNRFQTDLAGFRLRRSIDEAIDRLKDVEFKKRKGPSFVVFTDLRQFDLFKLARSTIAPLPEEPNYEAVTSTEDYYKLRALFGDLDLEKESPELQSSIAQLHSVDAI